MNFGKIYEYIVGTPNERRKPFNWKTFVATAILSTAVGCGVEYNVMGNQGSQPVPVSSGRITPGILENRERRSEISTSKKDEKDDKTDSNAGGLEIATQTENSRIKNEIPLEAYAPNTRNLKRAEQKYFQYREVLEVAKVLFAEAGNQSRDNRRLIARMMVNRLYTPGYQKSIWGIIHKDNSFSCTFDGSKQWAKAIGKAHKNEYEESVFQDCLADASAVMQHGWTSGIPGERDLIAYHDISMKQAPNDKYWNSLKPITKVGRLVWYAEK